MLDLPCLTVNPEADHPAVDRAPVHPGAGGDVGDLGSVGGRHALIAPTMDALERQRAGLAVTDPRSESKVASWADLDGAELLHEKYLVRVPPAGIGPAHPV
jgi:hypothetical protein